MREGSILTNMNSANINFGATSRGIGGNGVIPGVVSGRRRQMRTELTDEQKAEIREAFEIFDMDKDGALDFHEFKVKNFNLIIISTYLFIYLSIGCFESSRF